MFYCPNCQTLELNHSYKEQDYIFTNCRDGYGLMFRYVICKNCEYPLSAVINNRTEEQDDIEYHKHVITAYQNGEYETKETILNIIRKTYEERYLKSLKIVEICDKFNN